MDRRVPALPGRLGVAGFLFLGTLAFYWPTLGSFPGVWTRFGMGHGWLIAGLVAWLIVRNRGEFTDANGGASWVLVPLAAASILWFSATVAHVQVLHQFAFGAAMMLWAVAAFGRRVVRPVLLIGLPFLLALPVWEFLVGPLRRVTTVASGGLIDLMGIDHAIQGDMIHIAAGSFRIAEGCSGLAYLLAAVATAAVYTEVFGAGWRRGLGLVALAAGIAIVGNWVRVAILILVGHLSEMQSGLIQNHDWFGWAVFAVGLLLFFVLGSRIDMASPGARSRPSAPARPPAEAEVGMASPITDPIPGRARWIGVVSMVAVLGPASYFVLAAMPPGGLEGATIDSVLGAEVRDRMGPSEGTPPHWEPSYQGATLHESRVLGDGHSVVRVDRFVYLRQRQGAKLIGYPNQIAAPRDVLDERLVGPVDPRSRRWVRQAMVRTPDGVVLVWYWYRVGGVETYSPIWAKLLEVRAFLTRRRVSELVAFSADCGPESCAEAFAALSRVLGTGEPAIPE